MDIVAFQRNKKQHKLHLERIRNIQSVINTSKPESLGLKHLAFRPKKQQLIDDQRAVVAKENAKMMEMMSKRMAEVRPQPKYVRPTSLNEVERKMEVDRLNFENSLLLHRIKTVPPVISVKTFEKDFERHLHAESVLRKKMPKPYGLPKDFMDKSKVDDKESLFDASTYSSQQGGFSSPDEKSYEDSISDSPIKSMTDFRKHVISSKRMQNHG